MSAPNDPSGMEIDLLKGSTRSLRQPGSAGPGDLDRRCHPGAWELSCRLISSKFATPGNLLNVFQNACFIGIMALGMTPVIISGGIDISVGSILGMCAVTLGIVLNADMPLLVGILVTLAVGIACGAFNGAIIAYIKLPPFIVTLATLSIGRSLALVITNNQVFYEFGQLIRGHRRPRRRLFLRLAQRGLCSCRRRHRPALPADQYALGQVSVRHRRQ